MSLDEKTVPTFFLTYWRPWEEKSNVVDSFLDYAKDTSISKYTSDSIGKFIQSSSVENVIAINNLGHQIGFGFDYLGDTIKKTAEEQIFELKNIKREISFGLSNISNELFSISLKLDLIIARLDASNLLLKDISKLLRVPDSEKERQRFIELGLKFFISADKDEDLYDDALNEFLKAEKLMQQDYFTLYYIGLIYLLSPNHINVELANMYFSKSGKYGFVESLNDSIIYENVLDKDSFGDNKNFSSNKQLINKITSAAYEKTAYSYYILGDYINALKFQQKALEVEKSPKNYFFLSKYQNRNSLITDSCNSIKRCLELEPKSVLSILSDLDLISSNEILDIVAEKNNNLNENINILINDLLDINYLDSKEQVRFLEESKEIRFDNKLDNYYLAIKRKQEIIDFINNEEKERKRTDDLENQLQKENQELIKFKEDKLLFFQEYTFIQLYYKRLGIESDLILEKVEQVIKEEAFKGIFSLSERLEAKKQASRVFSILIGNFNEIKNNKDYNVLLLEEFNKFNLIDENINTINREFELIKRIDENSNKSVLLNKSDLYTFDKTMKNRIDFLIDKKILSFNKIIHVTKGLNFNINSYRFNTDLKSKTESFYGDSKTKSFFMKYLDVALKVYTNEIN